jgi:hypothetical protein
MGEEVSVEDLERELRELESEKTVIEIKPVAETTAVVFLF